MTRPEGDMPPAPGTGAEREGVAERARAGLEQARQSAGKAIAATRRKGEAVIDDTREKSIRAAAETNRLFLEHPITAVAAAAAAGAVLAIFVPRIAIAGKAGQMAGRAVKAAATSDAAQRVLTGLKKQRKVVATNAAGIVATTVGRKILASAAAPRTEEPDAVEVAQALPPPAPDQG